MKINENIFFQNHIDSPLLDEKLRIKFCKIQNKHKLEKEMNLNNNGNTSIFKINEELFLISNNNYYSIAYLSGDSNCHLIKEKSKKFSVMCSEMNNSKLKSDILIERKQHKVEYIYSLCIAVFGLNNILIKLLFPKVSFKSYSDFREKSLISYIFLNYIQIFEEECYLRRNDIIVNIQEKIDKFEQILNKSIIFENIQLNEENCKLTSNICGMWKDIIIDFLSKFELEYFSAYICLEYILSISLLQQNQEILRILKLKLHDYLKKIVEAKIVMKSLKKDYSDDQNNLSQETMKELLEMSCILNKNSDLIYDNLVYSLIIFLSNNYKQGFRNKLFSSVDIPYFKLFNICKVKEEIIDNYRDNYRNKLGRLILKLSKTKSFKYSQMEKAQLITSLQAYLYKNSEEFRVAFNNLKVDLDKIKSFISLEEYNDFMKECIISVFNSNAFRKGSSSMLYSELINLLISNNYYEEAFLFCSHIEQMDSREYDINLYKLFQTSLKNLKLEIYNSIRYPFDKKDKIVIKLLKDSIKSYSSDINLIIQEIIVPNLANINRTPFDALYGIYIHSKFYLRGAKVLWTKILIMLQIFFTKQKNINDISTFLVALKNSLKLCLISLELSEKSEFFNSRKNFNSLKFIGLFK